MSASSSNLSLEYASRSSIEDAFTSVGYSFSAETRESRHDRRISAELPPYLEYEALPPPEYTLKDEPITLAMYLFKFGFLFPPFWILGMFILSSPLRAPPATDAAGEEWLPDKTDAEKQIVLDRIRRAELKWGRRCLVAFVAFTLILVAGFSTWAALCGYL
ncbi:hypothetical protein BDZ89DRAFT_1082823 [Hymenopellis radicata]|nr:hypothetical protein BDZ89DRAFT_1082823 [Hymenopellis radicata]